MSNEIKLDQAFRKRISALHKKLMAEALNHKNKIGCIEALIQANSAMAHAIMEARGESVYEITSAVDNSVFIMQILPIEIWNEINKQIEAQLPKHNQPVHQEKL